MKSKKILLSLFAILFIFPVLVNAKEYCTVVSGNGKDIGSEIACGDEHFYIVDNDDEDVKMLAKYNLDGGYIYNKVTVTEDRWNELFAKYGHRYSEDVNSIAWANQIIVEPEFGDYYFIAHVDEAKKTFYIWKGIDSKFEYPRVTVSEERFEELKNKYNIRESEDYHTVFFDSIDSSTRTMIVDEPEFVGALDVDSINMEKRTFILRKDREVYHEVKQNEIAIGAHGGTSGEPEFPEYGILENIPLVGDLGEIYSGGYQDVIRDRENRYDNAHYLEDYEEYLESKNFEIKDIDLLGVKDIDDIVKKLSNRNLPLEEWYNNWQNEPVEVEHYLGEPYYILGSIKEYLPEGYEWLYSTTYWTKTLQYYDDRDNYHDFVDTLGNLCNRYHCDAGIGAGVRPVVTIARNNIIFKIETETDNNGTIDVIETALGGEEISFTLKSRSGYHLKSLILKTESGLNVEFTEVTENLDGTITVGSSKFLMPMENVKIIANWAIDEDPEPEPTPSEPEEKDTVVEYTIKTVVEGDGKIDVVDKSASGEEITFKVSPLNGSKLVELTVKDKDGRTINFTKVNENGEVVTNKYTMPENDVVITAKFETIVSVPKTGDNIIKYVAILAIAFIVLVSITFIGIKNNKKVYINK